MRLSGPDEAGSGRVLGLLSVSGRARPRVNMSISGREVRLWDSLNRSALREV